MAVSKTFTGLKCMEIPYSDFTWDSTNTRFIISNFTPPFNTVVGYLIVPTNGMAIMSGYYNPVTKLLSIVGWIPVNAGAPIESSNGFKCFVIGY